MEPPSGVACVAMKCLATAYFARMHGDIKTMAHATALYGEALPMLNDALRDTQRCFDHQTLSAAMALNLYETIAYTNALGWVEHAGGMSRLVELRGPHRHQEYPEHGLFLLSRQWIMLQATINRKRTFLETAEWQNIPWQKHPETKTHLFELQTITCAASGCFADWNAMMRSADQGINVDSIHQDLKFRLLSKTADLIKWRYNYEFSQAAEPIAFELPVNPLTNPTVDEENTPLFDSVLHFKNLKCAAAIALYNCTLLLFRWTASVLGDRDVVDTALNSMPSYQRPPCNGPLIVPHEGLQTEAIVRELCRTVDYHLLEAHSTLGVLSLAAPLRVCLLAMYLYHGPERQKRWLKSVLHRMADTSGFEICRRLCEVPVSKGKKEEECP
ncbi:hypothetical protein K402DRAFT_452117 [Aulographum hederae CBS 113979]|uniref:Transcription factor domain-containing protein n=1 Tax=Aulographum hederae CBS 113979 TaxID=1176131 RepID=A0A6G1H8Q2_9PEZI|nr:hypothetical protein K402DRAFT_452117 [Aulographum hederae CBS 113979]